MISNGKELYSFLDKLLKPHGFVKNKDTYYLDSKECICFLSIGKSPFGGHYDHVLGGFVKEINEEKGNFPKFNKSHLKYSLRELANPDIVKEVFDLENNKFVNNERELIIEDLIVNYAIPFLKDISSKSGIKNALNKYENLQYSTTLKLKKHLGIRE